MPLVYELPSIPHATLRMAQRDISQKDVEYVLLHGHWHCIPDWRGKADRYEVTLSRRHILTSDRVQYGHLAGTVVVIEDPGIVVTVMKKRPKETDLHLPYVRETGDWRRYLGAGHLS